MASKESGKAKAQYFSQVGDMVGNVQKNQGAGVMSELDSHFSIESVLDALPQPVIINDHEFKVLFINKAYEKLYKVKKDEVLGRILCDVDYMSNREKSMILEKGMHAVEGKDGHNSAFVLEIERSDHHLHYWSAGVAQNDGREGMVGLIVDITAQKNIERRLKDKFKLVQQEKRRLEDSANRDYLTGLYNRKYLDRNLETWRALATTGGTPFSCLMIDVDHFKEVNDSHGHDVGDQVLREVADVLRNGCRGEDIIGRVGGDEFMVLLLETSAELACSLAKRLCAALEKKSLPCGRRVTMSMGVSGYQSGDTVADVLKRADSALLVAKRKGKNCVWPE